jgi:hypothetical protein
VVRRSTLRTYQLASRIWLSAAVLSLLLPADVRLGWWLPLHLALAGAVSLAIAGAMQNFALTLAAAPDAPSAVVWTQFVAANLAAALLAIGYPSETDWLVAAGGAAFVLAVALLGWLVRRARRIGLNRRHGLPFAMYGAAIFAALAGGALGAVVGSGIVDDPSTWLELRRAHLTLNVLGWASLTIAGTLITFLPTVLRIRMPVWHGTASCALLVGGVAAIALGLGLDAGSRRRQAPGVRARVVRHRERAPSVGGRGSVRRVPRGVPRNLRLWMGAPDAARRVAVPAPDGTTRASGRAAAVAGRDRSRRDAPGPGPERRGGAPGPRRR